MLSRMNARSSVPQGAGLAATASAACDHCHIEGIVLLFLYQVVEATLSHSFFGRRMEAVPVLKLLALVIALIIAAMVAGAYLHFNPAIPIFIILGFGIYRVGRIGGPQFPEGTHVSFGDTYGVHLHGQDFVPPDSDSHSGGNLRGVNPNERKRVD
jgi:hypothetical protein